MGNMTNASGLASRTFRSKPDFDECMARVYAWYEQKFIDRPPVRFHHHNIEYERTSQGKARWARYEDRWLDVDHQMDLWEQTLAQTKFLGETFPVFWPNLSAVVYNLFLGQQAVFDDATAWTHPCIDNLDDLPALKVQRDNVYFKAVGALTESALERAEDRFMVGFSDLYAGMDCAMGLRGTQQLCVDLYENPTGVHALIGRAFAEYADVYNSYDRTLKQHGQLSVTWINLPVFERFNVLACDFAVYVSRDHFDEFCMPVLGREAALFTHNVFHVDGPGVAKNIDSILTLENMPAIQWAQGYGKDKPIRQWIPLIRKIQDAGKSVVVDLELSELDDFMRHVDPAGIMLWIPAAPEDQPEALRKVQAW